MLKRNRKTTRYSVDISAARAELSKGTEPFKQYVEGLSSSNKSEDKEMLTAVSFLAYTNTAEMTKDTALILKECFRNHLPKEYKRVKSMLNIMTEEEKNYPDNSNLIGLSKVLSQVCINYQYMVAGSKTAEDFELSVSNFMTVVKLLDYKKEPVSARSEAKKYIKFIQHDVKKAVAAL